MLIIGGLRHEVIGREGASFLELPAIGLQNTNDWRPRQPGIWVRGIVVHTRMGRPVSVRRGQGPNLGWDVVLGERFSSDSRQASAHVAIDADGSYACLADLQRVVAYHAGQVNDVTVGIEMFQSADGGVWESTLRSAVDVIDTITRVMGIQRQFAKERAVCRRFASPSVGVSRTSRLAYVAGGARGRDFCGVYGHRNCTGNRGMGDPGDEIFALLAEAGYEGWLVDQGDDLDVWAERQKALGFEDADCDGIPAQNTRRMLAQAGRACGLWVPRPGDQGESVAQ